MLWHLFLRCLSMDMVSANFFQFLFILLTFHCSVYGQFNDDDINNDSDPLVDFSDNDDSFVNGPSSPRNRETAGYGLDNDFSPQKQGQSISSYGYGDSFLPEEEQGDANPIKKQNSQYLNSPRIQGQSISGFGYGDSLLPEEQGDKGYQKDNSVKSSDGKKRGPKRFRKKKNKKVTDEEDDGDETQNKRKGKKKTGSDDDEEKSKRRKNSEKRKKKKKGSDKDDEDEKEVDEEDEGEESEEKDDETETPKESDGGSDVIIGGGERKKGPASSLITQALGFNVGILNDNL